MKSKRVILTVSIVINIILAVVLLAAVINAYDELKFNYVEEDTITPDTLRSYLERENYGVVANLSRPIRGGAEIEDEYLDYYMLGEYADLMFLKEIFAEAGNTQTVNDCEQRLGEIRSAMPEYSGLFDKIDYSAQNALPK